MQEDQLNQTASDKQIMSEPPAEETETRVMEAPTESVAEETIEETASVVEETVAMEDGTADGETVETAETAAEDDEEMASTADNPDTAKAFNILQVEDLINRQMADIEKMREDVKLLKSSYEDIFKNDAKYREFDDKMKDAKKQVTAYKQAMMKDPSVAAANQNYMQKKDELKDLQLGLSDYLREYNRVSGMTQFETKDGQVLEIVQTFKLVKK